MGGTTCVRRDGQAHLRWWPSLRPPWAGTLRPLSISTTYGSSTSAETLKGADPCPARPDSALGEDGWRVFCVFRGYFPLQCLSPGTPVTAESSGNISLLERTVRPSGQGLPS